jgi:plasmid stabilization system protein ParE
VNPVEIWLHPAAEDEANEIYDWYFDRSPVAAASFRVQLDRTIALIAEAPTRPALYRYGARRMKMRRFPVLVVYRVLEDGVEVIAISHGKRRPGYWRNR